jgi:hypothetical protein
VHGDDRPIHQTEAYRELSLRNYNRFAVEIPGVVSIQGVFFDRISSRLKPLELQPDGGPGMAGPYPAEEFRRANPVRDNQPSGIFPDKMARESLKALAPARLNH